MDKKKDEKKIIALLQKRTRLGEARVARSRVVQARTRWAHTRFGKSSLAIEEKAYDYPLACVAVAAGAGWALGRFVNRDHPSRARAVVRLVSTQVLPWVAHMLAHMREPTEPM